MYLSTSSEDSIPAAILTVLEGYETSWSVPSKDKTFRYENLPPGEYTLHIRGGSNTEYFASSERCLTIRVRKAWYLTNWAIGTYVLVEARKGDIFSFEIEEETDFKFGTYKVKQLGEEYQLEANMRFADARAIYTRIFNAEANRFSFDILHIDPILIESGGGKRKQIFESLDDDDKDWEPYDDNVVLKRSFRFKKENNGIGTTETKMSYGSQSFKNSFSASVGVSAEVAGVKGSQSLGFTKMTKDENALGKVYTFARRADTVYYIDLVKEHVKLDRGFKDAVLALPNPEALPNTLPEAKRQPGFATYKIFVTKWGTHFPTRVYYGGFLMAYKRSTMTELLKEDGYGVSVKQGVSVPVGPASVGVEGSFGYSEEQRYVSKNSTEKTGYFYLGGMGGPNDWTVDNHKVQPIKIQLSRLNELLTPAFFKDETSESELAGRKAMLKFARKEYIGSATDDGTSLKPKIFELKVDRWEIKDSPHGNNKEAIYGHVKASLEVNSKEVESKYVWNRSDKPGSRVTAFKGYRENFSGNSSQIL